MWPNPGGNRFPAAFLDPSRALSHWVTAVFDAASLGRSRFPLLEAQKPDEQVLHVRSPPSVAILEAFSATSRGKQDRSLNWRSYLWKRLRGHRETSERTSATTGNSSASSTGRTGLRYRIEPRVSKRTIRGLADSLPSICDLSTALSGKDPANEFHFSSP